MKRNYLSKGLLLGISLLLGLVLCAHPLSAQRCGGIERWPVKVGTDSGVNRVNLAARTPISIAELISLPSPALPPRRDHDTRLNEETHVYEVNGFLVSYKLETGRHGDQDYHLVITDDTFLFTRRATATPPGHSFVAEIPNPQCIPGRAGNPNAQSRFATQIATTRQQFEAQFPRRGGGFHDAGRIPVRIVGVGYFDRPHGQTGRATNNIELHPVLEIAFGVPQPPPAGVIQNPSFENQDQQWTSSSNVITDDSNEPAHTGDWKAWFGGYGTRHTDTLYQIVTIPANATSATLSFYLHISTEEDPSPHEAWDTLKIQIRRPSGQWRKNLAVFSNLQAAPGFTLRTFDLSRYRGETIRIQFQAKEDAATVTSFVVDDVGLVVH